MTEQVITHMHTLTHITLVNWYLFTDETIPVDVGCTLIRGFNGVGKSSLADAIQVVLAGADETQKNLNLNAASNNGGKSGRSIRSYCLGIVTDVDGEGYAPTRESSNTYLCLAFRRHNGTTYSIGVHLYCRKGEANVIQKHRFTVDGAVLTATDFMQGEHTVIPWKGMEQRLANTINGKASFFRTAQDFRMKYCELMSHQAANHQISPDMMLQAFKNGISFKEQKSIDAFTRDYILPKREIDVLRIESDYEEYTKIEALISSAREKLESLNAIINQYKRYQSKLKLHAALEWSCAEAKKTTVDEQIYALVSSIEALSKQIQSYETKLAVLNSTIPQFENERDSAKAAFDNSEPQKILDKIEKELHPLTYHNNEYIKSTANLCQQIDKLIRENRPFEPALDESLVVAINQANLPLKTISERVQSDLLVPWYLDSATPEAIEDFASNVATVVSVLDSSLNEARVYFEDLRRQFNELTEAYNKATQGKATLRDTTIQMIALLGDDDIQATPVCELATITDPQWQKGIEHFLGSNREALVVEPECFERALRIYRKAKSEQPRLRQVKLVNPDKRIWGDFEPTEDMAASLIESEHLVAKRFLRGLLFKVYMVDTEAQLREVKRGITKDGMVAGNGAISGGNHIDFVLIGQDARKQDAQRIQELASRITPQLNLADQRYRAIKQTKTEFESIANKVQSDWKYLSDNQAEYLERQSKIESFLRQKDEVQISTDDALRRRYSEAEQRLTTARSELIECELAKQKSETTLEQQTDALSGANKELSFVIEQQRAIEASDWYEAQHASDILERLMSEHQIESQVVVVAAQRAKDAAVAAQNAKSSGKELLVAYCTKHDPIDKKELLTMDDASQLSRCEAYAQRIETIDIVIHETDARAAREKMLENFRAEVVAKLKECFQEIDYTFSVLNAHLSDLTFNDNKYQFKHPVTRVESLRAIHEYITDTSDLSEHNIGGLFDEDKGIPVIEKIQNLLLDGRLNEISDYRNFYNYDIIEKKTSTGEVRSVSNLLSIGSGGEQQTPFYVALGASFMSAYRINKIGKHIHGGAALAVFDEAFSRMDGNNSQSALAFFKGIGLQVILVAPPEIDLKSGRFADRVYNVLRDGGRIFLDPKSYTEEGKTLLDSDNPFLHPSLMQSFIDQVRSEIGVQ